MINTFSIFFLFLISFIDSVASHISLVNFVTSFSSFKKKEKLFLLRISDMIQNPILSCVRVRISFYESIIKRLDVCVYSFFLFSFQFNYVDSLVLLLNAFRTELGSLFRILCLNWLSMCCCFFSYYVLFKNFYENVFLLLSIIFLFFFSLVLMLLLF